MKKITSKLIASLTAALIILPVVTASAATNSTSSKFLNGFIKQQTKTQNVQQKQQIKSALAEKKDIIKKNHETNAALREEIKQKKNEVKTIIKNIKDSKIKLTSDNLSKIEEQVNVIQTQIDKLQETKGTIKQESALVKDAVKKLNLNEAIAHLDKIISIQNTRTEILTNLNTHMDTLIILLNTASGNSTPAAAAPTAQLNI